MSDYHDIDEIMSDDENPIGDIADNAADKLEAVAKKGANAAAKEGGKVAAEGGKAIVSLLETAGEAIAELIATHPGIALAILAVIIVIIVACFAAKKWSVVDGISNAITSPHHWFQSKAADELGGLDDFWDGTKAGGDYEDEINEFNGLSTEPLDADQTAKALQKFKAMYGAGDLETATDPDELNTVDETYWSQLMNKETRYFTQENMIKILQDCADYNNDMFRYFEQFYEYKQWRLKEYYKNGVLQGVKWVKTFPVVGTTGDGLFEKLSKIHIEGELDENGERRFAVHWQDVMACAYMMSVHKGSEDIDTSDIVDEEGILFKTKSINPETFIKDAEMERIFKLFAYNFDYYYGTTAELVKHNTSAYDVRYEYDRKRDLYHKDGPTLREGDYQLAYRYKRLPDPVDDEDDHGADYASAGDVPDMEAPYTKFVPDRAPNLISNSYDAYKYIYISTDDVPDYTPDPDKYEPPEGMYCIGRWHIQNPKNFIDALDSINPHWHYQALGESGKVRVQHGYNWVQDLVEEYCEILEKLPFTDSDSHTMSRMDFFENLGQMYQEKKIIVSYEGTTYDGMDDFIQSLQDQYPGWHIVWEKDYVGEFGENLTKKGKSSTGSNSVGGVIGVTGENRPLTDEEIKNVSQDVLNVAKTIYGEARGESYEGKIAVAEVIRNRMKRDGKTATEIVSKPNQFDGYQRYKNRDAASLPGINELINIAYNVLNGNLSVFEYDDVVGFRSGAKPETHGGGTYYMDIGGHHFYSATAHTPQSSVNATTGSGYSEMVQGTVGTSVMTGSFYPAFAEPSTYPFWSYGVTFHPTSHFDDDMFIHLTDQEYDQIDHWAMTYEELRLRDAGDMLPTVTIDGATMLDPDFISKFYINQGDPRWASILRGASSESIQRSGCLDSTVAMIASWWTGQAVSVTDVSKYVGSNAQLNTSSALSHYGLKQSGNIYGNFTDGVISEIKQGRIPIVHIRGKWTSSSGEVLHSSSNGHFLTIYGYDETGFYVADPGKRANSHINYSDWGTVGDLYYRSVTKAG